MSQKMLIILTVVIIALFSSMYVVNLKKQKSDIKDSQQLLKFNIDQIKKIKIKTQDSEIVLSESKPNHWVCESKSNYKADLDKISELLIKCSELKSNQIVTSNPDYFQKLGLDQTQKISLSLFDDQGKLVDAIDFGNNRKPSKQMAGNSGKYVKPSQFESVYLIKDHLTIDKNVKDWLNKTILVMKKKEIESIELLKTEPKLTITVDEDEKTTLNGILKSDKKKDWAVDSIFSQLEKWEFNDIIKPMDIKLDFEHALNIILKKDMIFELHHAKSPKKDQESEEEHYLKIKVSPTEKATTETKDIIKKKNDHFSNWVYQLNAWDASLLTKTYADLTEKNEEEEKEVVEEQVNQIELETPNEQKDEQKTDNTQAAPPIEEKPQSPDL